MRPSARLVAAAASAVLALSPAALAAPSPPVASPASDNQRLGDLAYILGQSHALHRVCAGQEDGFWYELMQRLIQTERPEPPLRRQLIDRFNQGFAERQAQHPDCSDASRTAAVQAALQGQALISTMGKPDHSDRP